jgi:hypothetical protein
MEAKIGIRILSVDWDYFFPDVFWFDWSQKEESIFLEFLWPIRYGNAHLKTGEMAKDIVKPDKSLLCGFWEKVCPRGPYINLTIAESHKDVISIVDNYFPDPDFKPKFGIWNFDQHHDGGYGMKELNCDNWVHHLWENDRLSDYNVIYPPWREERPEEKPEFPHAMHYKIPILPDRFEFVFICRSSGWTPSWCDDEWIKFIEYWKKYDYLWETKSFSEYALKKRPFDYEKAMDYLRKEQKIRDQIREDNLKIMGRG